MHGINNLLKLGVCVSRNQVVTHYPLKMTLNRFGPVFCSLKKSTGTADKELLMLKTTVWRVLHKHLVIIPYCIQMIQLLGEDHRCGLHFCLQLQELMSSNDHFLEKLQFSDEVTFDVSGAVNHSNVRIWGSENPHGYVEHQHDSPKVAFCAISSQKVYSPFLFVEETVTGMTYLGILQLWLMPHRPPQYTTNLLLII